MRGMKSRKYIRRRTSNEDRACQPLLPASAQRKRLAGAAVDSVLTHRCAIVARCACNPLRGNQFARFELQARKLVQQTPRPKNRADAAERHRPRRTDLIRERACEERTQ